MARPSMAEISGTALVGGTELAQALAAAMGEGAVAAENMDVGSTASQDVQAAEDEGLISQGTPGGFQSSTYSDSVKREPGESFVDYGTRMNREMYPGHYKAAQAYGATGINAFGQKHKDLIENNKSQMRAMGIQPSHKNNAGQLTGRYSSNDWKAFQKVLAGGTMATEDLDDETITMEESPGLYPNQIGITPPQGHPDWELSGVAPNQGPYTSFDPEAAAMGMPAPLGQGNMPATEEQIMGMAAPLGGGASPYVDDFSAYGQQVQPGVPAQIGMGTGYAPTPEESNMGMGLPLGGGGSPLVDNFSTYGQQVQPGAFTEPGTPGFPLAGQNVPGVGTMATEEFDAGIPGEYAFAGPQTAPGTPGFPLPGVGTGVESFTGMPSVAPPTIEETQMGMGAPMGGGMIAQGTQAFDAGVDQIQSRGVALNDAAAAAAAGRLTGDILGIEQLMRVAMPIAEAGKDKKSLISHGISEGGTLEQQAQDLIAAGVPKEQIPMMAPSAIAMLHFALTQLVLESGTENVTFADLEPYIDRINQYSDSTKPNLGDPSQFLDKRNPPFTGESKNINEFLDKRNPPFTGNQKDIKDYIEPM